jgi:hypothetical protein
LKVLTLRIESAKQQASSILSAGYEFEYKRDLLLYRVKSLSIARKNFGGLMQ